MCHCTAQSLSIRCNYNCFQLPFIHTTLNAFASSADVSLLQVWKIHQFKLFLVHHIMFKIHQNLMVFYFLHLASIFKGNYFAISNFSCPTIQLPYTVSILSQIFTIRHYALVLCFQYTVIKQHLSCMQGFNSLGCPFQFRFNELPHFHINLLFEREAQLQWIFLPLLLLWEY